jgi:hypothetical protein
MAGTVELVALVQVLPAVFRLLDDKISVQIPVRLLCLPDDLNDLVRPRLQSGIRSDCQGEGSALQPFRHIAVLKHHPIKLAGL